MSNIRKYYENKFREYPDVVDLLTFRQMMGGISDSFARLLIHEDRVQHISVSYTHLAAKRDIIERKNCKKLEGSPWAVIFWWWKTTATSAT